MDYTQGERAMTHHEGPVRVILGIAKCHDYIETSFKEHLNQGQIKKENKKYKTKKFLSKKNYATAIIPKLVNYWVESNPDKENTFTDETDVRIKI
jgi:hypothetical protein